MLWGEIPLENLRYVNSLKTLIMDVSHLGSKAPEQAWLVGKAKVEVLEIYRQILNMTTPSRQRLKMRPKPLFASVASVASAVGDSKYNSEGDRKGDSEKCSAVYENDLKLCKIIETNQAFSKIYKSQAERPQEIGIKGQEFYDAVEVRSEDLTDERVYTIICRWQGLRVLQDLYLDTTIGARYSDSTFPYVGDFDIAETTLLTEDSVRISHVQNIAQDLPNKSFNARQTQRFYKALTSYWLALESHWLLCRSIHDTWKELWKLSDSVNVIWSGNPQRDVLESLDLIETYDFVYGFLLRMPFANVEMTLPWLGENGSNYFENGALDSGSWAHFVQNCRLFLQPAHIIELLAMACASTEDKWLLDKTEYLQSRGAFETLRGTALTDHPDGVTLDFWMDIRWLEDDACSKIQANGAMDDANRLNVLWRQFRDAWKSEARRRLFWWADSSDDIGSHP